MRTRPLVVIAMVFAAGIAAAYYSSWPLSLIGLAVALAGVVLVLGLAFWSDGRGGPGGKTNSGEGNGGGGATGWSFLPGPLAPLLLAALFFFLGAAWGRLDLAQKRSSLLDDLDTYLDLIGRVTEEPRVYKNRTVYVLEAWEVRQGDRREAVREKVEVSVYRPRGEAHGADGSGRAGNGTSVAPLGAAAAGTGGNSAATGPPYRYGDVLEIHGQLELPPTARNPGEFDYRTYLARRGVFTRMGVEPENVRLLGHRPASPFMELVCTAKARALAAIEGTLPPREAGILAAILFGDQERLEEEDVEVYRSLGVYHVFAVSGQQVGFVLLLALALARVFCLGAWGRFFLGAFLVLFYMSLTAFAPSVTRAGVMALVGLGAAAVGEENDSLSALAAAALAILFWRPYELLGPGFQLSFLATWGMIYLQPLLDDLLGFLPPWRRYLTATLAAQVAVLWHTALYFNIVSLGALLANLLVLPVIGAVTVLGLLLLFASLLLPALASSLALACGGLLYGLSESLAVLAGTPGVVLAVASPPWWSGLGYLGLLAALPELRLRRAALRPLFAAKRPALIFVLGLLPCLVLTAWRLAPGRPGILEVVFLDVGQGDATYVRTPAGTNLLIDAGGTPAGRKHTFDVGEKVVLPYLVRRGVKRLDLVVSTHPDADHLQGLFGVLRHLPASLVVLPPPSLFGQGYTEFLTFLCERGIPYREVTRGSLLQLEPELRLTVLHPPEPAPKDEAAGNGALSGSRRPDNNLSLVLKLERGEISFLFTGDLEAAGMTELLGACTPHDLKSTVFKVPHHGSPHGLEEPFLAAAAPRLAVIQVGRNEFGHPSPSVLRYWQERNIPVYRTDRDGAVTILTDGKKLIIRPFLSTL